MLKRSFTTYLDKEGLDQTTWKRSLTRFTKTRLFKYIENFTTK